MTRQDPDEKKPKDMIEDWKKLNQDAPHVGPLKKHEPTKPKGDEDKA